MDTKKTLSMNPIISDMSKYKEIYWINPKSKTPSQTYNIQWQKIYITIPKE